MSGDLYAEISKEDEEGIQRLFVLLKAIYDECVIRAGMEAHAKDGIDYLASARELKSATDEFRIEEFQKNSKKFTQLKKNYDVLIAAQKERVKRLNDFVDNLGIAVDFATVLDDAAKIAAGLAQSL